MARQESLIRWALRSVWVRTVVALAVGAAVAWLWWEAFVYFRDDLDLPFLAWPAGIMFLLLVYLVTAWVFRNFGPHAAPLRVSPRLLARRTSHVLSTLEPVSHRVHPLGNPWPQAVVGIHGVYLVEPRTVTGNLSVRDGEVLLDGHPAERTLFGDLPRLRGTVSTLLREHRGLDIPVYGLSVVDDAVTLPPGAGTDVRTLGLCHVDQVVQRVTDGPALRPEVMHQALAAIETWRPR